MQQNELKTKLHLHHFGLTVANLEETFNWYEEKLGFARGYVYKVKELKMRAGFMTHGGFRVEFFEVQNSAALPDYRSEIATNITVKGLHHIALSIADIEETKRELESRGVEFVSEINEIPDAHKEKYVFFKDNNGVLIELFEPKI